MFLKKHCNHDYFYDCINISIFLILFSLYYVLYLIYYYNNTLLLFLFYIILLIIRMFSKFIYDNREMFLFEYRIYLDTIKGVSSPRLDLNNNKLLENKIPIPGVNFFINFCFLHKSFIFILLEIILLIKY